MNVSSGASRSGAPFEYVDYATSKGAMDTLTKGLSLELAERNIRVNGVRPGFIYTDMHADGGEPNRVDRLSPQIPLKRGGTVEVANAIAWLLSDEASYVTGSFIDIAGADRMQIHIRQATPNDLDGIFSLICRSIHCILRMRQKPLLRLQKLIENFLRKH